MSITQGTSRSSLGALFRAKRNFKLRLVSSGVIVKTDYNSSVHTIQVGHFVAIMGPDSTWVDIGQISGSLDRDPSGFMRYGAMLVPRLIESIAPHGITVPSSHIVCRLVVINE